MCGLFGFVKVHNQPIAGDHVERMLNIATEASRRGPHSFGYARYGTNTVQTYRQASLENYADHIAAIARMPTDAIIGTFRLATFGSYQDSRNNQPIRLGNWRVCHNGNIYGYARIFEREGHKPQGDSDTEALALLAGRYGFAEMTDQCNRTPNAVLACDGEAVYAYRHEHPLWMSKEGDLYLCSRPFLGAVLLDEKKVYRWPL